EETFQSFSSDRTRTATPSPRPQRRSDNLPDTGSFFTFPINSSPPHHNIQSSPPVRMPYAQLFRETPPQVNSRKRKSMGDSGYISSLESSVRRGSDDDGHRLKRGRAEEDIARIRRSSV